MGWTKRWRKRLRALVQKEAVASELDEELAFHLEMQTQKNLGAGMSPEEARRQARLAFGGVERFREEVHEARMLGWVSGLSLDLKLGLRMLVKYPGLTLVGVLGMAVAIAVSAASFEVIYGMMDSDLPLDEGDSVVMIQHWDAAANNPERQVLHDFVAWREEVRSVRDLGAFRTIGRNLIVPGGVIEPISIAEMTASGFRVARVPPLLGRYLVEEDEQSGAPPVVVIGYDVWQNHFMSDPAIVGREVRLGNTVHTIVGVMPEGFAFPRNHSYWTPFRANPSDYARLEGPAIYVFGRLAPGVTLDEARAELTAIGQRTAAAFPETHEKLRPHVLPYTHPFADLDTPEMIWTYHMVQLLISLLLVVVAVNVAILVYARTATRMGEIVIRSALGASRGRIVTQLFVEALILAAGAAAVGLLMLSVGLKQIGALPAGNIPFWLDFELSPGTVLYAAGLAAFGAVVVGVVPALKATGRRMQSQIRQLGGGTGMQMGRTWTVLIVAQVAIAVAIVPTAIDMGWDEFRDEMVGPGPLADEILTARLALSQESSPSDQAETGRDELASRLADRITALEGRLLAEPGISGVTFASSRPGEGPYSTVEIDDRRPVAEHARREVQFLEVSPDLFDVLGATVLAGRLFQPEDLDGGATAVIANRTFVQQVLGGDALARRVRYTRADYRPQPGGVEEGRWYEIVGVVDDSPANEPGQSRPTLYHPAAPGELNPVRLIVRVQGVAPEAFAGRLREITMAIDPTLQLYEVLSVEQLHHQGQRFRRLLALAVAIITLSVLLLSAAGIHALMAFTVAQRRKEIGIRTALGAHPRRLLASVFARALRQLAIGVLTGFGLAVLLDRLVDGTLIAGTGVVLLPAMAAIMTAVGLLAATGPAARALRIQPVEALKAE